MSTNRRKTDFDSINAPLSMKELVEVLVKHYGLADGDYDLGIEFHIGTGPVGPNSEELVPGVVLGVKSVGLAHAKPSASVEPTSGQKSPSPAKKPRAKKTEIA